MTAPRHYDAWADPREAHEDVDPFGPGTEETCDAATDNEDCDDGEDRSEGDAQRDG